MEHNNEYNFIAPYITSDEFVLWKGKPQKGMVFTSQDVFMIPFSIMWCGFAIFWETSVLSSGAPFFFALWGIPFILVGLYITIGRFFHASYLRKRTYYVITNKKIIRLRRRRIDMIDGRNMPPMHLKINKDGSGTIRFGEAVYYRHGRGYRSYNYDSSYGGLLSLENVPNVAQVQQIIDQMDK
ncbi:MAG: PH domain-containing protein [Ruminococcaceae bacterium]|nr:PH domain-containing protein [Oscillospiraceae bacterium]